MSNDNNTSLLPPGEGPGVRAVGASAALNPYVQVALTYIRRPFSSWPGRVVSASTLVMILLLTFNLNGSGGGCRDGRCADAPWQIMLLPFGLLFMYLAVHMKEQFADSRAHLTPGFRNVHAAVAAAVVLAAAAVLPAVLTWLVGLRTVGLVALSLSLFGAVLWLMLTPSAWLGLLMAVGWFALFIEPGRGALQQLLSGEFEAQAVALLVFGAVITLRGGIRLVRLNEDMPEYHTRTQWDWTGRSQMNRPTWSGEGRLLPGLGDWIAQRQMARLTRHAQRARASRWSRVCRWRIGMVTGGLAGLIALGILLYGLMLVWMTGQNLPKANAASSAAANPVVVIFSVFPQCFLWGAIRRWRLPMLAHEVLLPVERRTYVRQLGMAATVSQLQLWAGMSVAVTLWFVVTAGQPLPLTKIAGFLAVYALLQPWLFGMGAWFVQYRSVGLHLVGLFLALYVPMIPLALCAAPVPASHWKDITMPLAGIISVLGLLLTYGAYRRWLRADFD